MSSKRRAINLVSLLFLLRSISKSLLINNNNNNNNNNSYSNSNNIFKNKSSSTFLPKLFSGKNSKAYRYLHHKNSNNMIF